MATYCTHEVRFRGRLVSIHCRYNTPQSIGVVKGRPLPELTSLGDIYVPPSLCPNNPQDHINKVFRALFRVLRRKRIFSRMGHCKCQFY